MPVAHLSRSLYSSQTPFQLHALILGIDTYQLEYSELAVPRLRGARADAESIRAFLIETLGVPTENITSLLNRDATRDKINSKIKSLLQNDATIFLYFAGYGATIQICSGLQGGPEDAREAFLVPYDAKVSQGIVDNVIPIAEIQDKILQSLAKRPYQSAVRPYSSHTVITSNTYLQTFILDCGFFVPAHWTSRNIRDGRTCLRNISFRNARLFRSSPTDNIGDSGEGIVTGHSDRSNSHPEAGVAPVNTGEGGYKYIKLTACSDYQGAFEREGKGLFTRALLAQLEFVGNEEKVTAPEVVFRMGYLARSVSLFNCLGQRVDD